MNNSPDRNFTITTEDGKTINCQILFTHHADEFNKDYVVFVEEGTNQAHASVFVEEGNGQGHLEQVETEEEWEMLEELLNQYVEEAEKQNGSCGSCSCGGSCSCDSGCDCEGSCCEDGSCGCE